ncbi:MAG TPA: MFS transporter [Steroidobacteraceae bacterium]|nr:MFS transporter [Steroidobacteraceae bacterium]
MNDVSDTGRDPSAPNAGAAPARGNGNGARKSWLQAVLVYRQPRMIAMLFLGFSGGLPFMLVFQTLSAWLRQAGIDRATIGMLSWASLFYTLQFVWAPVVDRVQLPILHRSLGRRRSWMLLAQLGIVAALFYQSLSNPALDILHVAIGSLVLAFCAATQDIAMNAWRIESAPEELQGAMAAAYQLGFRAAIIVATAGALEIAQGYGWHVSYAIMAALGGVGIVTTLLAREPEPRVSRESLKQEERVERWLEERAHWPASLRRLGAGFIGAVVCPFVDFFKRYGAGTALIVLLLICSYRLTEYAMGSMMFPFYIDHHYTLGDIALVVKLIGLAFSIVGVIIAGAVIARIGVIRALVLGALLIMASNLAFAALARTHAPTLIGLGLVNVLDNLAQAMRGVALVAFMSGLTSARYTATQYALFSSLYALPGKLLEGTSGFVVDAIGYPHFFTYTASLAVLGLLFIYFYYRRAPAALTADSQSA